MMARGNLSHPATAVPSNVRPKYEAITASTDAFCKRRLPLPDRASDQPGQSARGGAIVVVAFPKPKGGSGFPARVFAIVP